MAARGGLGAGSSALASAAAWSAGESAAAAAASGSESGEPSATAGSVRDVKVLVLGGRGCGKSSLVRRLVANVEHGKKPPHSVGMEMSAVETVSKRGDRLRLCLWDTSADERWLPMLQSCLGYDDAEVVILVYASDNAASFEDIVFWRNEVLRDLRRPCRWLLVGTRSDQVGAGDDVGHVTAEQAAKQSETWGMKSLRCSAENGDGILELLAAIEEAAA